MRKFWGGLEPTGKAQEFPPPLRLQDSGRGAEYRVLALERILQPEAVPTRRRVEAPRTAGDRVSRPPRTSESRPSRGAWL